MAADKKQYIIFRTDCDEYGADISKVNIIERYMNITRVPTTPPYIKGVINLRGDIIPVMDLRTRFGLKEKEAEDDTRIIIFNINKVILGVIVDAVVEVVQMEEVQIESVTGIVDEKNLDYISGVAKIGQRLITFINVEKLISDLLL